MLTASRYFLFPFYLFSLDFVLLTVLDCLFFELICHMAKTFWILLQMDYINTSHPNFIGGSKAVELALQQAKSSRAVPLPVRQKVCV